MALTGKTIGELTALDFTSNSLLLPVEGDGATWHIPFSSINSAEVTYEDLTLLIADEQLIVGQYYLITDFKTCYDQPDYNYNGTAITVGNYRTGSVSPILVLATSGDSIAELAYQPQYPGDIISYDPSFSTTEVTDSPAFGRITYRKDNQGNEFDYDFREVLFKRYDAYVTQQVYDGTITVDVSGSIGVVTGVSSSFTNFTSGNVIGVLDVQNFMSNDVVNYYEIISIEDDFNMTITGSVITNISNTRLVNANLLEGASWKQNNIISNTSSVELLTFGNIGSCFNNKCINTSTYTVWDEYTFLLPNNVFKGGGSYVDNSFGSAFRNNTFDDDCDSNEIRAFFSNNIITNDFDDNTINDNFNDNIIVCDFQNNIINGSFYNNQLGDDDGVDFDYNTIDGNFYSNLFTGYGSFEYNTIKRDFYQNTILDSFSTNVINGFSTNTIDGYFDHNVINGSLSSTTIRNTFSGNIIGEGTNNNVFLGSTINNSIGNFANYNTFQGDTQFNIIGHYFTENTVGPNFSYNQIGNYFVDNIIANDFGFGGGQYRGNVIGNGFQSNNIGEYFYDNNIGDNFTNNTVGNYFQFNRIETQLNNYDFTEFLGRLNTISYPETSGANGVYTGISALSTSGTGIDAIFSVTVSSSVVTDVQITSPGKLYQVNDTITLSPAAFGGGSPLVLTVETISSEPMVYGYYNKTIQRDSDSTNRLTALVNGNLYITQYITEPID